MKNWAFLWSSKRQPVWESTLYNLNIDVGSSKTVTRFGGTFLPPVNISDAVKKTIDPYFSNHSGQILEQFENEAFKFVIEKNYTNQSPKECPLIIKLHMFLDLGIDEYNCKPINLNKVEKYLEDNEWVALGFFINGNDTLKYEDRANTLSKSTWYTRKDKCSIYDLERDEYLPNNYILNTVTYVVFRKLSDTNIIMGYVNHHLIALPSMDSDVSIDNKHKWTSINLMDDNMFDALIKPSTEHCKIFDNIIIYNKHNFKINLFEQSELGFAFDYVPKFDVKVNTNLKFKSSGNSYEFEPKNGYIAFEIRTNDFTKKYEQKDNAGVFTLTYLVQGE